jgi:hypothetical protein
MIQNTLVPGYWAHALIGGRRLLDCHTPEDPRRRSGSAWRWERRAAASFVAVMRGAMLQAIVGLAIGIPVAIFCVRYVKSQLYEVTSVNVPVMTIAIGVLVLTAAIPGIIPARRAASTDPARVLRIE